jgi:hypothetical protein
LFLKQAVRLVKSHEKLSTHEKPGSFVRPGFIFYLGGALFESGSP